MSSHQIPALMIGVIGLILELKILEAGLHPLKLLNVLSPEVVTETSILTGFLPPSELTRTESEVGGVSWLPNASVASQSF